MSQLPGPTNSSLAALTVSAAWIFYGVLRKIWHSDCTQRLKAGGKPSTWLPPGGLVERFFESVKNDVWKTEFVAKFVADFEKSKILRSWPGPFPPLFGKLKFDSEAETPPILSEI